MRPFVKWNAVVFALAAGLLWAASAQADSFTFTFSDPQGDVATGTLNATASGLGDDSLLVTSGTLDITAVPGTSNVVGIYNLIPVGPAPTPGYTPIWYVADDLLYPNDDAASGVNQGETPSPNPSYLTMAGIVFGSTGPGEQDEVNIWGTGSGVYTLDTEVGGSSVFDSSDGTFTLTQVPEPGTIGMLLAAIMGLVLLLGMARLRGSLRAS